MLSSYLFRLFVTMSAKELTDAAYAGILARDADADGRTAYAREISRTGDLSAVLASISSSRESWEKHLYDHPEECVRLVFRGLLGREPEPEASAHYAGKLAQWHDLAVLLSEVTRSREHWERLLGLQGEEVVRAAFRGLLEREPDAAAQTFYVGRLAATRDLTTLLAAIRSTREHWDRMLERNADELVHAIVRGLLDREPDASMLAVHGMSLAAGHDIASVIREVARSAEFQEKSFQALVPDLVREACRGILEREADPDTLLTHTANVRSLQDMSAVVHSLVQSDEFAKRSLQRRMWPDPAASYDHETVVHLHIQKTAGSSLNTMLREAFHPQGSCSCNNDTIYLHSPGELSQYSLFLGHVDHDSLSYIPRRTLSLISFVRHPRQRVLSLYQYWRAHEPGHKDFHQFMQAASELSVEQFCTHEQIRRLPDVWNHMTWVIMGRRQWFQWQAVLTGIPETNVEEFIRTTVRPAVRKRLREFLFVGIQEDFERSVDMLFRALERQRPTSLPVENRLADRVTSDPLFKKDLMMPLLTPGAETALEGLVQLDSVVYDEARLLYAEHVKRSAEKIPVPDAAGAGTAEWSSSESPMQPHLGKDRGGSMPSHAGLTREEVIQAFRVVLGRAPESEEAITAHQSMPSLEMLGRTLVRSEECRSISGSVREWSEPKWVCTPVHDGLMMWVDLSDRYVSRGCLRNNWEPGETACIASLLGDGDCFIDCGANIGWFTLLGAQRVGPAGLVIAFEPRADIFSWLQRSVALNGYSDQCRLYQIALGDAHRQALLRVDMTSDNPGNTYLLAAGGRAGGASSAGIRHETVTMLPLDHYMSDRTVTLIKIDVEGAEPALIAGASRLIRRDHPIILSEVFDEQLRMVSGMAAADYFRVMGRFGYIPCELRNGTIGPRVPERDAARKDPYNVLFIHPDKHQNVMAMQSGTAHRRAER